MENSNFTSLVFYTKHTFIHTHSGSSLSGQQALCQLFNEHRLAHQQEQTLAHTTVRRLATSHRDTHTDQHTLWINSHTGKRMRSVYGELIMGLFPAHEILENVFVFLVVQFFALQLTLLNLFLLCLYYYFLITSRALREKSLFFFWS